MRRFALILAIIGALNWGIIGVFGADLLGNIFGGTYALISRIIYSLVGLAGIYLLFTFASNDND
ncbi:MULTISPECIES: DUF378 domain-containing protein [Clostridia]|uniref:DUF378 domain-containing protein n=1 Tax=Clostridium sp. CCUG 7971 TaxID=2811414 RepID=UPI001ABA3F84|nr:DUF378 domain-containing protein [Clostridium sp. CCUG 7971]MBO3445726.1 DUF378 domain-containing protein [Clostridium sp. CCUG 7971]